MSVPSTGPGEAYIPFPLARVSTVVTNDSECPQSDPGRGGDTRVTRTYEPDYQVPPERPGIPASGTRLTDGESIWPTGRTFRDMPLTRP